MSEIQIKKTSTTLLEYKEGIVFLRLLEGADFDMEATIEQFKAQAELVGERDYAVLVDATKHVTISKESRNYMSAYKNPKRKATALLTKNNLAMCIVANFYLNINKPLIPTRMFTDELEAIKWMRKYLPIPSNE